MEIFQLLGQLFQVLSKSLHQYITTKDISTSYIIKNLSIGNESWVLHKGVAHGETQICESNVVL